MTIVTKYWFPIGLILVCAVTLTGFGDPVAMAGRWVRAHHGADITMVVVFFFSGAMLQTDQIRRGLRDLRGTTAALLLIFVMAPLVALPIIQLPFSPGVRIGLLLVAVMPTTLSSGVVMTGAAGGNVAQALLITVFANVLAVFTIPVALSLMVPQQMLVGGIHIDKWLIMRQLFLLVILPLWAGLLSRSGIARWPVFKGARASVINQSLVLAVVWMAVSQSRSTILQGGNQLLVILGLVVGFHVLLLIAATVLTVVLGLGPGRREVVFFMGAQKTLPLSILLQVNLFPGLGPALVFSVTHHFVHLMIDSYLVAWFNARRGRG